MQRRAERPPCRCEGRDRGHEDPGGNENDETTKTRLHCCCKTGEAMVGTDCPKNAYSRCPGESSARSYGGFGSCTKQWSEDEQTTLAWPWSRRLVDRRLHLIEKTITSVPSDSHFADRLFLPDLQSTVPWVQRLTSFIKFPRNDATMSSQA